MRFLVQKKPIWTQNQVFQVLQKIECETFSDFLRKVTLSQKIKMYLNYFFLEKVCLGFLGQNGPKMRFFKLYGKLINQCMEFFWFFCTKLQKHEDLNWLKWFFGENLSKNQINSIYPFLSKWAPILCNVLKQIIASNLSYFLHEVKTA